jgi:hypothetical protein
MVKIIESGACATKWREGCMKVRMVKRCVGRAYMVWMGEGYSGDQERCMLG